MERSTSPPWPSAWALSFSHTCLNLACSSKECTLCRNNPEKRCAPGQGLSSCYIEKQALKARCNGDIFVQLRPPQPAGPWLQLPNIKIQVSVADGSPHCRTKPTTPEAFLQSTQELLLSDQGRQLLGSDAAPQWDRQGRILLDLHGTTCLLPEVHFNMKTDDFLVSGRTFSSFRLVARAMFVTAAGQMEPVPDIVPAVSSEFVVKSARAVQDFFKPDYVYYKDSITKLKHIGGATAAALFKIREHIPELSIDSIGEVSTVEQLMQLIAVTDRSSMHKAKLQELMKAKGIQQQKWAFLRSFLADKVVFDDDLQRAFFPDDSPHMGLLFRCHRGQINMQEPQGFIRLVTEGGQRRLEAMPATGQPELLRCWLVKAQAAWAQAAHPGWTLLAEPLALPKPSSPQLAASAPSAIIEPGMPQPGNLARWPSSPEDQPLAPHGIFRRDTHPFPRTIMDGAVLGPGGMPSPLLRSSSPGASSTAPGSPIPSSRSCPEALLRHMTQLQDPALVSGLPLPGACSPFKTTHGQGGARGSNTLAPQPPLHKALSRSRAGSMLRAASSLLADTAHPAPAAEELPRLSPFQQAAAGFLTGQFVPQPAVESCSFSRERDEIMEEAPAASGSRDQLGLSAAGGASGPWVGAPASALGSACWYNSTAHAAAGQGQQAGLAPAAAGAQDASQPWAPYNAPLECLSIDGSVCYTSEMRLDWSGHAAVAGAGVGAAVAGHPAGGIREQPFATSGSIESARVGQGTRSSAAPGLPPPATGEQLPGAAQEYPDVLQQLLDLLDCPPSPVHMAHSPFP